MCESIYNTATKSEINSLPDLVKLLGTEAKIIWSSTTFVQGDTSEDIMGRAKLDTCLCDVNIQATMRAAGYICEDGAAHGTDWCATPPSGTDKIRQYDDARWCARVLWTAMYPERTPWCSLPKEAQEEWIRYAKLASAICSTRD